MLSNAESFILEFKAANSWIIESTDKASVFIDSWETFNIELFEASIADWKADKMFLTFWTTSWVWSDWLPADSSTKVKTLATVSLISADEEFKLSFIIASKDETEVDTKFSIEVLLSTIDSDNLFIIKSFEESIFEWTSWIFVLRSLVEDSINCKRFSSKPLISEVNTSIYSFTVRVCNCSTISLLDSFIVFKIFPKSSCFVLVSFSDKLLILVLTVSLRLSLDITNSFFITSILSNKLFNNSLSSLFELVVLLISLLIMSFFVESIISETSSNFPLISLFKVALLFIEVFWSLSIYSFICSKVSLISLDCSLLLSRTTFL